MDLSAENANQQQLKKLLIAIKVNAQRTGLLIAICDDVNVRNSIVEQYETKLQQEGVNTERTWLALEQPSLHRTLTALENDQSDLVVTVLGASDLRDRPLAGASKSPQEEFFYSLQWTRESLLRFKYPIILWLTDSMATQLAKRSPDFWSWRAGIFEFQSLAGDAGAIDSLEIPSLITEYRQIIHKLEQQDPHSPLLIQLYNKIGEEYRIQGDLDRASNSHQAALQLSREHNDKSGESSSLVNLSKIDSIIDQVDISVIADKTLPFVRSSGSWYRSVSMNHRSQAIYFSSMSRFGSEALPVTYVAEDPYGMFIDTFPTTIVSETVISSRTMFEVRAKQPLLFADLTGSGLLILGQKAASLYGPYPASQHLAKMIWLHPMNFHGIKYRCGSDLERFIYAIFQRAERYLTVKDQGNLMIDHSELLANILSKYQIAIHSHNMLPSSADTSTV